uniref:Uncharacterized protein n=1 Tax=Physcomitrium patens TaxID=3218 RepID=A0A2K1L8M1_PHYPA|nr:hypothetical protein PHYPA_000765 [Physcomitrium patens]
MSHSVCGECSELEFRAAGGSHVSVGGDMIGHGSRAPPAPKLQYDWKTQCRKSPTSCSLAGAAKPETARGAGEPPGAASSARCRWGMYARCATNRKIPASKQLGVASTSATASHLRAQPGNRTPVSTVGGYCETTTPAALLRGAYSISNP